MKRTHATIPFIVGATCLFLTVTCSLAPDAHPQEPPQMALYELIAVALQSNPHVRAARERWASASHQIQQNYAPADPIFSYSNVDSPSFPLYKSSLHTIQVTQPLQFPGKALFPADQAKRTAELGPNSAQRP
jgi:hypothetical protein